MGSRRNQLRARATSERAKKSAIALSLMSSLLSVASPSCAVAWVRRPLCGTAAILNRPSCHNLLCTILDFADARKPELCCVAVTVRSDNPSLLANHRRSTKKGEDMTLRSQRLAEIREHIKAESSHDMKALLAGMTSDCFNDVAAVPKPFRGPKRVAERYRKHWAGFPDFKVRVKRLLAVGESTIVTENEWSGTHLGKFLGYPPTGKYVRVRALVVWHFKGKRLWGETVFFDMGSLLKRIGARISIPRNRRRTKRRD